MAVDSNTPANRALGAEVDACRIHAKQLQREEKAGRVPRGSADRFREELTVALKTVRLKGIGSSDRNGVGSQS
jgi:hypothetical protein